MNLRDEIKAQLKQKIKKRTYISVKIVFYMIISILGQHFYHFIFRGSGGGIAILIFTVCNLLDKHFSLINIIRNKMKDNHNKKFIDKEYL